jgi:hypothetical protein
VSAIALAKAEARYTRWRPGRQSQPSLLWSGISRILCPLSRTGDHLSHAFFTCPGPLLRVRPIPEVHSPLSRKVERATHTSALSCTTWGLSRDLAYAKIRWALTPPFHPCPAPSLRTLNGIEPSDLLAEPNCEGMVPGGLFSETLSVTWDFRPKVPPFSRGTLPSGVRTFLWPGVNHASDRLPQSKSNTEEASAPGKPRTSRQEFG